MNKLIEPKFKKGDIVEVEIVPGTGPTGEYYDAIFEVVEVMGLAYRKGDGEFPLITISKENVYKNYHDRFHTWIVRFKFLEGDYQSVRWKGFQPKRKWEDCTNESFVRYSEMHLRENKIDELLRH